MMSQTARDRVLVVEDDPKMLALLDRQLRRAGYEVDTAADGSAALAAFTAAGTDLILADVRMPELDGVTLMEEVRALNASVPVVLMTAFGTIENAVEAMRRGATDYVSKPFRLQDLLRAIDRAIQQGRHTQPENHSTGASHLEGMIGNSLAMQNAFQTIRRAAGTDCTVLITGASGTGKEMAARAIHRLGLRSSRRFVVVDCSAMPEPLLESELFGYVQGAFTGAARSRTGLFEQAGGGTLFLDEISCLPLSAQAKLLRAVQEYSIRRLGSNRPVDIDVRYLAATNTDLTAEVNAGRFREDLYFRLNVLEVHLPPLRDRTDDIRLLSEHFFELARRRHPQSPASKLGDDLMEGVLAYDWPGNVRQLANAIEHAVVLCAEPTVGGRYLPAEVRGVGAGEALGSRRSNTVAAVAPLKSALDAHVNRALEATAGNRSLAAELLGIDRRTLQRHLSRRRNG